MEQGRIREYVLILFGAIVSAISLIGGYLGVKAYFFDFIVIIITLSIGLIMKRIISEYISSKHYNLINILTVNNIVKSFLLLILIYHQLYGNNETIIWKLTFQCSLLDLASIITACYIIKKKRASILTTYVVIFTALFTGIIVNQIESRFIAIIIRYIGGIGFISLFMIRIWGRKLIQNMLNEKVPFFIMLLEVMLVQQLVYGIVCTGGGDYSLSLVTIEFLQVFYLMHCILYICLYEPWNQKMEEITKVDATINAQNKSCDMIVNLSHELKTPVNVIRSALDILALDVEGELNEEVKTIKKECNQLMNLIQDMIDIQKINTHHIEVDLKNYNIVELIENVIDAFVTEIKEFKLVFNPKEEEINQVVDGLLMQKCFMLLIGLLIRRKNQKSVFLEISVDPIADLVEIYFLSDEVSYLKKLYEELKLVEENKHMSKIEDLLTIKLIQIILGLHNTKLEFISNEEMVIYLKNRSSGKRAWLDERNIAVLNDQIRCRYIEA